MLADFVVVKRRRVSRAIPVNYRPEGFPPRHVAGSRILCRRSRQSCKS